MEIHILTMWKIQKISVDGYKPPITIYNTTRRCFLYGKLLWLTYTSYLYQDSRVIIPPRIYWFYAWIRMYSWYRIHNLAWLLTILTCRAVISTCTQTDIWCDTCSPVLAGRITYSFDTLSDVTWPAANRISQVVNPGIPSQTVLHLFDRAPKSKSWRSQWHLTSTLNSFPNSAQTKQLLSLVLTYCKKYAYPLVRGVSPMLACRAVVITSLFVEQHCVAYKISIPQCLYFRAYFNRTWLPRYLVFRMYMYL